MMRSPFFAISLAAALVACGDDGAATSSANDTSAPPSQVDADGDGGGPRTGSAGSAGSSGGAGSSGSDAPAPEAGDGGGPASSSGGDATTCEAPRDLGALSGDTAGGSISAQGTCGGWVRVRVTEDDHSVFAAGMELTATLVSPAGEDFDLDVYVDVNADDVSCTTPAGDSVKPAGQSDVVKVAWGEEYTANDADDSRTVNVRVSAKDGKCADTPWTLLLQGAQQ